ncbi:hypothetical protein VTK73DRAFT_6862 [Phialemonium thermophilum]|uniref:Uncharacterized protein n=1 Tax=Phialemonium thermophilum TaxID=223376 RepID=A0ABR3XVX5_9PEZI
MFSFSEPTAYQSSKCHFTYGTMGHLDPRQLPSKGKPWITISSCDFIRRVELVLPQESLETVRQVLITEKHPPEFRRVTMPLIDILSGDFFKKYVKLGEVLMLSEGRMGIDNVFSLRKGNLTLFLDKETYERAGLVGKPEGAKGNRGQRPRWVVEFDLRAQSMYPGKKGFDRLVYACKTVLKTPVTWLFCNVSTTSPTSDPLAPYFPITYTSRPAVTEGVRAILPALRPPTSIIASDQSDQYESFATELYEWFALIRLGSLRVESGDEIDPYLCRYKRPGEENQLQEVELCRLSWEGFISPSWARNTLATLILSLHGRTWFSFSATTFSTGSKDGIQECSFVRPSNTPGEYLLWEIKGP